MGEAPPEVYQRLARTIAIYAVLFYLVVELAGTALLAFSPQTAHGILRIIAFVLFCIGVQISWNGVQALIRIVMSMKT